MAKMVFSAACASCGGEVRKFIEFKAEPCSPDSLGERRYGFRCMTCKTIVDAVTAADGAHHRWADGSHLEA